MSRRPASPTHTPAPPAIDNGDRTHLKLPIQRNERIDHHHHERTPEVYERHAIPRHQSKSQHGYQRQTAKAITEQQQTWIIPHSGQVVAQAWAGEEDTANLVVNVFEVNIKLFPVPRVGSTKEMARSRYSGVQAQEQVSLPSMRAIAAVLQERFLILLILLHLHEPAKPFLIEELARASKLSPARFGLEAE